MPPVQLSDIAPRLARARDQFLAHRAKVLADRAEADRVALMRQAKLVELQRLVAHRELQLIRAYATGRGRYIVARQRKLEQARRRLQTVERTAR